MDIQVEMYEVIATILKPITSQQLSRRILVFKCKLIGAYANWTFIHKNVTEHATSYEVSYHFIAAANTGLILVTFVLEFALSHRCHSCSSGNTQLTNGQCFHASQILQVLAELAFADQLIP